jgi:Cupin-like domain
MASFIATTAILITLSRQAHPDQCSHMSLYDSSHPSACHSSFDWSTGDASTFPDDFRTNAKGNEVVLQAGDALYLPTYWFHYKISLELNFQCNTRSGYDDDHNMKFIETC